MENVIVVIGIIGSIVSILSYYDSNKNKIFHHIVYVFITAISTGFSVYYMNKISRINSTSEAAAAILEERRMNYTDAGFYMAGLAFFEKNRDLYPEMYQRMKDLCSPLCKGSEAIDVAYTIDGALKGVSIISRKK